MMEINNRRIGSGYPVYIVAEMSANHNQSFEQALQIIEAAKAVGADAIKLQTYTADTLTIRCDNEHFRIKGTIWNGRTLYDLYRDAYTPWEWQPRLKEYANSIGLDLFSTPFDDTAVKFLEEMNVPAYKIASFEIVDLPLVTEVARTGKPIIISTGMASLSEIEEVVSVIRAEGSGGLALLKCTSSYPALPEEMNLKTIPHLSDTFKVPAGLSDHTLGSEVAVAAVALGACIVEKHFTISREDIGPDSAFSLEPSEFKEMVKAIRTVERALGEISYEITADQETSKVFRRSLFAVQDIKAGDILTDQNVRSIRPDHGLLPKYLKDVLGKRARRDVAKGTPIRFELIESSQPPGKHV